MDKSLTKIINIISRKNQMCLGYVTEKYDLTAGELPFVTALINNEGITQEKLISFICVDKSLATRVINSLTKKGYVIRVQDEKDKRQNKIYLTEKARKLTGILKKDLKKLNDMATRNLDLKQIDLIYSGLVQINKNYEEILKNKE